MAKKKPCYVSTTAIFAVLIGASILWTIFNLHFLTSDMTTHDEPRSNLPFPSSLLSVKDAWKTVEDGGQLVLPNAMTRQIPIQKDDVTLLVHLSASPPKLARFLFLLHRWNGPSSVAIYISRFEDITTLINFCKDNMKQLIRADFHILLEKTDLDYPQNKLRELSLQHTMSDYFVTLDVDFMPNINCHEKLRNLIQSDELLAKTLQSKTIAVLPAFNYKRYFRDDQLQDGVLPNSKRDVVQMVNEGKLEGFKMVEFAAGHGPTNYPKWYKNLDNSSSFYSIKYGMRFEPYILGYRDKEGELPHYWETFRGFGYDKYSWFVELHYAGYKYIVLNDFFVIHLDHPYTSQMAPMSNSLHMEKFMDYLQKQYGATNKELRQLRRTVNWAKAEALKQEDAEK